MKLNAEEQQREWVISVLKRGWFLSVFTLSKYSRLCSAITGTNDAYVARRK